MKVKKPDTDLGIILVWIEKALNNCKQTGRSESALLWSDALEHLKYQRNRLELLILGILTARQSPLTKVRGLHTQGKSMNYISICSGIEAATVAFHDLGWKPLAFSEISEFPSSVLKYHYPDVPNLGDMTKYREWPEDILKECDLLVGGPPCQAFSVAGLRKSLEDERGNLTLVYIHIIDYIDTIRKKHGKQPVIFIYENVPGLLSASDNSFGRLLSGLVGSDTPLLPKSGWSNSGLVSGPERMASFRILDSMWFGVAQQRKRIFVVGVSVRHTRARECAGSLLPVEKSMSRHFKPSRTTGQKNSRR